MDELISIIVPVFNIEQYIERCVESIRKQTYSNLEIILVDDGSTDHSGSICDRLANDDSRIRVIHKKNGGQSEARNCGIEVAKGNYLMFIDGDDTICKSMVETLSLHMKKTNAPVVRCRMLRVESKDRFITRHYDYAESFVKMSNYDALRLLFRNKMDCSACLGLYRKDCVGKLRFPVGQINEDFVYLYKVLYNTDTIIYIPDVLYTYYYRKNSTTTKKFSVQQFDKYYNCLDMLSYVKRNCPQVLPEAHYYLQLQTMYLLKDVLLQDIQDKYQNQYKAMRQTVVQETGRIISSRWFSIKEKISILLMTYCPGIYTRIHKSEVR